MFTVILLMLAGIAVGYVLRLRFRVRVQGVVTVLVWALLFILGVEVGGNGRIMGSLHTLGAEALVLALAATLGSAGAAWVLWRAVSRKKGGRA